MSKSARVLAITAGAAFLALLDVTVVNLAIPALGRAYPTAGISELSWVITAYATLFAALLAPAGRLADVLGRRTLFRIGVGGFALMSAACAATPSIGALLILRALQGAAAALMIPSSLAIVLADAPPERRVRAVALWSAVGALAAAIGPSLGGVLVHLFGWRSLFVINVPTGLLLVAASRALPATHRRPGRLPDLAGVVLLAGGVGLLALGLSQGHDWGWAGTRTVASLGVGVMAVLTAIRRSWRNPVPALETRLWREPTFAFANAASLLYGTSLYAWLLLGVLVLTQLWGYSELQAGLAMTPGAVTASIAAVLASRARGRNGPRTVTVSGAVVMATTGLVIAATLPTHPDFLGYWLPLGLVLGVGMGLVTTGTSTAAALSLPATAFATGTGMNQTARQIGGAFGIATLSTLIGSGRIGSPATFEHVYVFCALAALAAAAAGTRLALPSPSGPRVTEQDDPHLTSRAPISALPWRRFVVLGDSIAEGIGDPVSGYRHAGWADRIAAGLGAEYLNLGRRFLRAHEIRATQLETALAFRPDLALVTGGGNDLMQPDADLEAIEQSLDEIVGSLRAIGCDVVMAAPFDITRSDQLPEQYRAPWAETIERMSELAIRLADRHDALLVDFRRHPASSEPSIYSRDRIHLNARGHAIAAAETLRALERWAGDRGARPAVPA